MEIFYTIKAKTPQETVDAIRNEVGRRLEDARIKAGGYNNQAGKNICKGEIYALEQLLNMFDHLKFV